MFEFGKRREAIVTRCGEHDEIEDDDVVATLRSECCSNANNDCSSSLVVSSSWINNPHLMLAYLLRI